MWGKTINIPRLQSWMADPDMPNAPSLFQKQPAVNWSEPMLHLKQSLENLLDTEFDYVLINYYRDGKDYIGFHADNEARNPEFRTIASVSLGATRSFLIRHRSDLKNTQKEQAKYSLTNGSLIVMDGEFQTHYKHSVPKELKVKDCRINLTFRKNNKK
eukprot:gene2395-2962_t